MHVLEIVAIGLLAVGLLMWSDVLRERKAERKR